MRSTQIVIVEDSDEDFDTVQDAARRSSMLHPLVRAHTGAECLRLLRGGDSGRDAHTLLVLLDLNTPSDDGRDVLLERRRDDTISALPVVVLSASASARDLQFCYANGANAYHVKPVDHGLHLRVLRDIFSYWLGSVILPA